MTVRTGFTSSAHGFPFPNWFPPGSPVVLVPTPFGTLTFGDANAGLCGGMVYAALDLFVYGQPRPATPTPPVFRYFCKRLLESWNLPFGVLKYYDGQRRPGASRMLGDLRLVDGLTRQTVLDEWPKIRDLLDTGRPAPLGLVKVASFDPRQLVKNHQVLAHGYTLSSDGNRVARRLDRVADGNGLRDRLGEDFRLTDVTTHPHLAHPWHHRKSPDLLSVKSGEVVRVLCIKV